MNYEKIKTSDPPRLLLNHRNKRNLQRSGKCITLSSLSIYYTWKNIKSVIGKINLKYQHQYGMRNLNYMMDHILDQIFKIILNIYLKKQREKTDNSSIKIHIYIKKKIESRLKLKQDIIPSF